MQTNLDKIRAMAPDDLALFLSDIVLTCAENCLNNPGCMAECRVKFCNYERFVEWLNQMTEVQKNE